MDRRSFMRIGMAGAATGIIAPEFVLADGHGNKLKSPMAGGLFYTKENPGRWAKKAGPHLPIIEKTAGGVKVVSGHPMKPNKHWIVKHMILDSDFNFIADYVFDPTKEKQAISEFKLSGQKGTIYAISVCNLHDSWVSSINV